MASASLGSVTNRGSTGPRNKTYVAEWEKSVTHIIKGANIAFFGEKHLRKHYQIKTRQCPKGVAVHGLFPKIQIFLKEFGYEDYINPKNALRIKQVPPNKRIPNKTKVTIQRTSTEGKNSTERRKSSSVKEEVILKQHPSLYGSYRKGKTHINVCAGDITTLKVDAIVSSANPKLSHKLGVAKAISAKAGVQLEKWSYDHISKFGKLDSTKCVFSPAFDLPCNYIIHAVGPHPDDYQSERDCFRDLVLTLSNVLLIFLDKRWTSVAIPPMCSGKYGMKPCVVADAIVDAISYSIDTLKDDCIREIIIVDIHPNVLPFIDALLAKKYGSDDQSGSTDQKQVSHTANATNTAHASGDTWGIRTPGHRSTQASTSQQTVGIGARPKQNTRSRPGVGVHPSKQKPDNKSSLNNLTTQHDDSNVTEQIQVFPSRNSIRQVDSLSESSTILNSNNSDIDLQSQARDQHSPSACSDGDNEDEHDFCVICCDAITDKKILSKCKHAFCSDCIEQAFLFKPACPTCNTIYAALSGDQPKDGRMDISKDPFSLPGYSRRGTIEISYSFPDGVQGPEHPSPGKHYRGIRRTCYLPDNTEGNQVLKLLKKAFDSRLTFTIGRSTTTGREGVLTWNDIHHKTRRDGGPDRFGYPDPSYLDRVLDELAAKGIK